MQEDSYRTIATLLASTKPEDLRQGLELVREEIARVGCDEAKPLFELVASTFYIDPLDYPELVPLLDEALSLAVGFGECVIPSLIEKLDAGDVKAQMAAAHALGRIGADAIEPLMEEYQTKTDPGQRVFILYALSKIKSPKIIRVLPLTLESAGSSNLELRDTATRALGKFVESISPSELSEELGQNIMKKLRENLADPNPGIRAKAVRSLGKLAKFGHLSPEEREKLKTTFDLILGKENFEWDRAYIVRKQAEEALNYV
jgi:HEAT repeat protein